MVRTRLFRSIGIGAAIVLGVYGLVYTDLVLRARSGYLEGERFMEWHRNPGVKKAHFDARFREAKARLDREKKKVGLSDGEYEQRLEIERFRRDEAVAESSLKYAYHWYKTVVDLFSPPESRWVRRARSRMVEAKELWRKELDAKKIPYEEYMLE